MVHSHAVHLPRGALLIWCAMCGYRRLHVLPYMAGGRMALASRLLRGGAVGDRDLQGTHSGARDARPRTDARAEAGSGGGRVGAVAEAAAVDGLAALHRRLGAFLLERGEVIP